MAINRLGTFTDREEVIALFRSLRGRDTDKPWPLLPILAFIAPGGSGKSSLIEYLRVKDCCLPDPQHSPVLPYAHLDFTLADAPKDLLPILVALRNQLQQHTDDQGRHLSFPRFDLGAAIASAMPTDGNLPPLSHRQVQRHLSASLPLFGALGEMGSTLGNLGGYFALIPPLVVGLQWIERVPALQELLRRMERGPGWRWYRRQSIEIGLPANASISQVLLRLFAMSVPGTPGRVSLVEQVLPAAFLADVLDALDGPEAPRAWSKSVNVVLFLDGFDALLDGPGRAGMCLLESLACSTHRKQGQTDPLLLVLGSRQRLLELAGVEQNPPFEEVTRVLDTVTLEQQVRARFTRWQQQLPVQQRYLGLGDLLLPVWLQDFGREHTRQYLAQLGEQEQTQLFADASLVQAIYDITHGHPLYTALAATAVLVAEAHGQRLEPEAFDKARVSPEVVRGHEDEAIEEYLLALFLRQLPPTEQQDLVFCAAPRVLDVATLRAVLQLPSNIEARQRWERYRRFTFVRVIDEQRIVLHPIVRSLLLRRLPPDHRPESDYSRTHARLRAYFHRQAREQGTAQRGTGDWQARLEEAYHALALGDAGPAIQLGIAAQQSNLAIWALLLETVAQAPTALMPEETEQQAYGAVVRVERHRDVKDSVMAIILYTWLISTARGEPVRASRIQHNLGNAYRNLPGADQQANLEQAITCYLHALEVYTREAFPMEWATTQNNLAIAYGNLPGGNRQANFEQAIVHCQAAMEVYTHDAFPVDWAIAQNNLGNAYRALPGGDRQANLERAIACFQAALEVHTREAFPGDWATAQNNLGIAYSDLPKGDRQTNLERAITCYQAALEIRTRKTFPFQWATTQNNLGNAYRALPRGDRQKNLEQAITCFQAALEVRTREAFPVDWAKEQNNLGATFNNLLQGDRNANLEQAITCFQAALEVRTREAFPVDWATTQDNLGIAYRNLTKGDRNANLEQAITCFQAALEVRARETFPFQWAGTQGNLGIAYRDLPSGDRQSNLEQAIRCFQHTLEVYTREAYPEEWATTQNNLGTAYQDLPKGDRQANLEQAIRCFQNALEVHTREAFPVEWAIAQNNLGTAFGNLLAGDRRENLKWGITCFQQAFEGFQSTHMDNYARLATENIEKARRDLEELGEDVERQ